jgi:hypothetical protein
MSLRLVTVKQLNIFSEILYKVIEDVSTLMNSGTTATKLQTAHKQIVRS